MRFHFTEGGQPSSKTVGRKDIRSQGVGSGNGRPAVGYRGVLSNSLGFGATEGEGLYVARDKDLAAFFSENGDVKTVRYAEPKNPLLVNEEPLPLLQEDYDLYAPLKKSDSKWIQLNKMAAAQAKTLYGVDAEHYDSDKIAHELTKLIRARGYDAVRVTSGGQHWDVLFDPKLK